MCTAFAWRFKLADAVGVRRSKRRRLEDKNRGKDKHTDDTKGTENTEEVEEGTRTGVEQEEKEQKEQAPLITLTDGSTSARTTE